MTIEENTMMAPTGEVDAGGEDDEGLADGERPDDGHLLGDQGEVLRRGELLVEVPKTIRPG